MFSASPTSEELFRAHLFPEPLVPVGGEPSAAENAELASALRGYAKRSGPDDVSSLTGFLVRHPESPWAAALLTDLGLEYYSTAHYSLAIDAWTRAWALAPKATSAQAATVVSRAYAELLNMDARLGRMDEMERLLKSTGNGPLPGPAGERVAQARDALWMMQNRPEIAFRCGPLALRSIRQSMNLDGSSDAEILKSASTQKGCSLPQVAELSRRIGLNYQMAYREAKADLVVPAVVHWKVGHYAAIVRKVGNLYELQDPTFGNRTWATQQALDAETSGYFLVPPGPLPAGWRAVADAEGAEVWGKGMTTGNDPQHIAKNDLATRATCGRSGLGMPVAKIHLMDVNLNLTDEPVGYSPPVGPPARCTIRYNQRDLFQPGNFNYGNLGPQWTSDWYTYITDNPSNLLADVNLYVGGGGQRTYTGFNPSTQQFAYQQYDQNLLTRTGPESYELLEGDGSKLIFSQSDGSPGTSRNIFMTQQIDPQGNAISFAYDTNLCLVSVTDAIGQVTTLTYGLQSATINPGPSQIFVPADKYKLTRVTDPFGRSATFQYGPAVVEIIYEYGNDGQLLSATSSYAWQLASITDVLGLTSQFGYLSIETPVNQFQSFVSSIVNSMATPYGTNTFTSNLGAGNNRFMEIHYPDGSRERVEYTQTNNVPEEAQSSVPMGMNCVNANLQFRNTYYWSKTACALGYGDYSKARLYHWLHTENLASTSGALESVKPPLEGRVWFDYPGQGSSIAIGPTTRPAHIGRVLDDGSTQLYTFGYNPFGQVTNFVDPLGRTLSRIYDTNGVDLLEIRQNRGANNDLLLKATYNSQHLPLTVTDAAGQATVSTYNARGQTLSTTNPRNETTTYTYDANAYLLRMDGPLPDTNDVIAFSYDSFGRVGRMTDVSGYQLTFNYDDFDRLTRITYPDATFTRYTYDRLDVASYRDRAGRLKVFEHDNLGRVTKFTDPLGRVTLLDWCHCGTLKGLTDPMGRTTAWTTDVEGRRTSKTYPDGTQVRYFYDNTLSRLREVIDERRQTTSYIYNRDNSLKSIAYGNAAIVTPSVSFTYDPAYLRPLSMTDGTGTTTYSYFPVTVPPFLGAGNLASVDGPLEHDTVTYAYDELGRVVQMSINGVGMLSSFDSAGRVVTKTNALGSFTYAYDAASSRVVSETSPNGQIMTRVYGDLLHDLSLQKESYAVGATPVSDFEYSYDLQRTLITNWSQKSGSQTPSVLSFGYDAVDQLLSAVVTNSGALVNAFAYTYDAAGNRLSEQAGVSGQTATYNALNEITTSTESSGSRSNEWDAAHRLVAVTSGSQRTEFAYDGLGRRVQIRQLVNGSEVSRRRFVWCGGQICEERDATGAQVTKRYFPQGMRIETGADAGNYYYTRDHLGSIHELTDSAGHVRARYAYDPFGRKTLVDGDGIADFGFAGMFWCPEAGLALTHFRAYDSELGRWLSRDPLGNAEVRQGPNLYLYAGNEPVDRRDPTGLCSLSTLCLCFKSPAAMAACTEAGLIAKKIEESPAGQQLEAGVEQLVAACESGGAEALPSAPQMVQAAQNVAQSPVAQGAANVLPPTVQTASQIPLEEAVAPYAKTLQVALETTLTTAETEAGNEANFEWARRFMERIAELRGPPLVDGSDPEERRASMMEALRTFNNILNGQ